MARLALVSRNPVMSMGLSASDHDILEVRPGSLDAWLESGNDANVDALVLDLGSPSTALRVVGDLRAGGRWIPVLLVASSNTGWDSPELLRLPGVDVLALPLDSGRLQSATAKVLRHPKAPPAHVTALASVAAAEPEPLIEDVDETLVIEEPSLLVDDTDAHPLTDPLTAPLPESASDSAPVLAEVVVEELEPELLPEPEPEPAEEPTSEPAVEIAPTAEPVPIPVRDVAPDPVAAAEVKPTTIKPRRKTKAPKAAKVNAAPPDAPTTPTSSTLPRRRATDRLGEQPPSELVTALLASADRLYTLSEIAEVIVEDAVKQAAADSGALLVPDDGAWRVAAGRGLRPLEYRYQLTAESWLVERVGASLKGILVEDSDVARNNLRGAPLASRTHLLAVPVPLVRAILLLSRDEDPPFTADILGELAHLADEAGPLLQRAIEIRALARALAKHTDSTEVPRG